MERKVRNSSLYSAFLSSFAFQAGYNYDRFQSLGLLAVMLSALKDIYPDPEDLREAMKRHIGYFNTNPYLATFTASALIRIEEESADMTSEDGGSEWMERFKQASSSLLGNLGDRFFWAGLRPLTCLLGVLAFLLSPLYGVLTVVVLYNIPQILIRAEGVRIGYETGRGVVTAVAGDVGSKAIIWVKRVAALVLGALVPFTIAHHSTPGIIESTVLLSVAGAAGWFMFRRARMRITSLMALIILVILYSLF